MFGFAEKLNIRNYLNSMGNCVHYLYRMSSFAEKMNIQNFVNSAGNCVHYIYIYIRNVWICREFEYPKL